MDRRVALSEERSRRIRADARARARAIVAPVTHGLIIRAIVRLKVLSRSCGEFAVQRRFRIQAARRGSHKDERSRRMCASAHHLPRQEYTHDSLSLSPLLCIHRRITRRCDDHRAADYLRLQVSSAKCPRANPRLSLASRRFLERNQS